MTPITNCTIDHIDLTTKDLKVTKDFYISLFVNFLGWKIIYDEPDYFMIGRIPGLRIGFGLCNKEFIGQNFDRNRTGLHHFAILVDTRDAIIQIYNQLLKMQAKILDEPKEYPQYYQNYYALYYEDPSGLKMEFVTYS